MDPDIRIPFAKGFLLADSLLVEMTKKRVFALFLCVSILLYLRVFH